MSSTPITPAPPVAPATVQPAKPLNALQRVELEISNFIKQRETQAKAVEMALANLHAVEGAIQGAQHILGILKVEAAKAEDEAKKLIEEAAGEVAKIV